MVHLDLPEVISVQPSRRYQTTTTRSWDFLGLNLNDKVPSELLRRSRYGEDTIIGIIDTGQYLLATANSLFK